MTVPNGFGFFFASVSCLAQVARDQGIENLVAAKPTAKGLLLSLGGNGGTQQLGLQLIILHLDPKWLRRAKTPQQPLRNVCITVA